MGRPGGVVKVEGPGVKGLKGLEGYRGGVKVVTRFEEAFIEGVKWPKVVEGLKGVSETFEALTREFQRWKGLRVELVKFEGELRTFQEFSGLKTVEEFAKEFEDEFKGGGGGNERGKGKTIPLGAGGVRAD